jgi:hypothetical protein
MTKCPTCQTPSIVIETRKRRDSTYRRYVCSQGHKFSMSFPNDKEQPIKKSPGRQAQLREKEEIPANPCAGAQIIPLK